MTTQRYVYGHDHTRYLRQLGRLAADRPEALRDLLGELDDGDRTIVAAEVALVAAERGQGVPPLAQVRAALFGEEG